MCKKIKKVLNLKKKRKFRIITGDETVEKKGNKEISNGNVSDESKKSVSNTDKNSNMNASIDTSFIINNVNIQHQSSSDQHTEL